MAGVQLSDMGRRQVAALAANCATLGLTAVITSPVQRARDTAGPIAASCSLPVCIEAGFDEVDFGGWTGLSFTQLAAQPEWTAWNTARGLAGTPGGETMLAVQARASAALQRTTSGRHDGVIAVVSHADVIKATLAAVLGTSLDLLHRFDVAPASRSIISLGDGWARVDAVNLPV